MYSTMSYDVVHVIYYELTRDGIVNTQKEGVVLMQKSVQSTNFLSCIKRAVYVYIYQRPGRHALLNYIIQNMSHVVMVQH